MKTTNKSSPKSVVNKTTNDADKTMPDIGADKTGTDTDADKTKNESTLKTEGKGKFEKPQRETDPDKTGIDINPDKTKKENFPAQTSTTTIKSQ